MTIDYAKLKTSPRLLIEAELKPLQGDRFQPTGFADLGAARYFSPDGTDMLLVESAQSVANRMELTCWDESQNSLLADLAGLPYLNVRRTDGAPLTNSILEAHRINSEYIMATKFKDTFTKEIACQKDNPVGWVAFRRALLKYDPGALVHGVFLEEIDGRLRVTRALSGFIEASDVRTAESGGVKNNFVQPTLKAGEGNVPFPRTEFTAKKIRSYFNLDLALLRGYGFPENAEKLLIALALFKVQRFLSTGMRLRTACDLEVAGDIRVTRPAGFVIPPEADLLVESKKLIAACTAEKLFASPPVTEVVWQPSEKKPSKKAGEEPDESAEGIG
jgi:CRISPR-associated protein Csb1